MTAIASLALGSGANTAIFQLLSALSLRPLPVRAPNPTSGIRYALLDTQVGDGLLQERLMARLSAVFGAVALLLAVVGLYGIVSYTVASRRAEIGASPWAQAAPASSALSSATSAGRWPRDWWPGECWRWPQAVDWRRWRTVSRPPM